MKNFIFGTFAATIFSLFAVAPLSVHAQELPKDSLYQLETVWKNQRGEAAPLKDFTGQSVIMTMTYTGCQYSCPMTVKKLELIEKDLKKRGIKKYRFVVASFDPVKDTPQQLKKYMAKTKLNDEKWTFLSPASDDEVRKLSVLLDISYQKIDGGDFSHSNTITLLDPHGRMTTKLKGLSSSHEELIEKVADYEKEN